MLVLKGGEKKKNDNIKSLVGQSNIFLYFYSSEHDSSLSNGNTANVQNQTTIISPLKKQSKLVKNNLAVNLDVVKLSDQKVAVILTTTIK